MPVDKALNIFLRNAVRVGIAPPVFRDLEDLPFEEDTSEDTITQFRQAGILPTRREAAERKRPRPIRVTQGMREFQWFRGQGLGTGSIRSLGVLPDTGTIKQIVVNFSTDGGTGTGTFFFGVRVAMGEVPTGTQLFGDDFFAAQAFYEVTGGELPALTGFQMAFRVIADRVEKRTLDVDFPVFDRPAFLIARTFNEQTTPGTINATIMASVIYDVTPSEFPLTIFIPPTGRTPYSASTRQPKTRTRARSTPRAAVLTVTQGGNIINQRTVAWESLAPNIRRDWFNRQVGGDADPNIRWIP